MALKKFCAKLNCRNLCDVGKRYCRDHEYLLDQQKTERHKQYDQQIRHRRDKQYTKFYHSLEWEKTRIELLAHYKGLDLYAYYVEQRIVSATMVHHIFEVKDDWSRRLDINNLIPVSDKSHRVIGKLYRLDKESAQRQLLALIERWNREMKG